MRESAEPHRLGLREPRSLRRQQHDRRGLPAFTPNHLHRLQERLGLHHHAGSAAIRHVIDGAMPIRRVRPQVVDLHVQQPALNAPADYSFREAGLDHAREDRHDIELHSRQ